MCLQEYVMHAGIYKHGIFDLPYNGHEMINVYARYFGPHDVDFSFLCDIDQCSALHFDRVSQFPIQRIDAKASIVYI